MERLPGYDSWKTAAPDECTHHNNTCECCNRDWEDGVRWFADVGEYLCPDHRLSVEIEADLMSLVRSNYRNEVLS